MVKLDKIEQHYQPSERVFVERIREYCQQVEDRYVPHLTDFLNPREIQIIRDLGNHYGLTVHASVDWFSTEYGRVIIAPNYYQLDSNDFELRLLEIVYTSKFHRLTHSQIMGSLLNQLGIDRRLFGDILLDDNGRAQIFVTAAMMNYFISAVDRIGRTSVCLKETALSDKIENHEEAIRDFVLLSSLRLDNVIATVLRISRTAADKLIASEKVKRNYQPLTKPTQQVEAGDMISVKGFGRFKLLSLEGYSKSGKHKATVEKNLNKKSIRN
ncbi:YlmH family RNA-binding protein [Streptococcus dentiloxodontae]